MSFPLFWAMVWGIQGSVRGFGGVLLMRGGRGRLGAVYNAGYFRMSTWIPFVWALVNVLVLILSSFSIQGGL